MRMGTRAWWVGLGAVVGFGAACDAGAEVQVDTGSAGSALGATLHTKAPRVPAQLQRPEQRPAHARRPVAAPLEVGALENFGCDSAAMLTAAGAVGAPVGPTMRYFKVMVRAGEVVTIGSNDPGVWMDAPAGCAASGDPGAFSSLGAGIVFANEGDTTVTRVFTAMDRCGTDGTFDLSLSRSPLAANATCDGALALDAGPVPLDGANASGWDQGFTRKLFFTTEVPARSRVRFVPQGNETVIARALASCEAELWSATEEFSNPSDTPRTIIVVAGTSWAGNNAPFSLTVETTALLPEASCTAPRALALGEPLSFDLSGGGPGPSSCWCFQPESVVHLEVAVAPGEVVRVDGRAAEGANVDVQLIELGDACADTCGDNIASGWGDSPASLRFENTGSEPVTHHLIATGGRVFDDQGGWSRAKVTVSAERE